MFKKLATAAALTLGMSAAAYASPITVGGITWDPDFDSGGASVDFGAEASFMQWYTSASTTTDKEITAAVFNDGVIADETNPASVLNTELVGVGEVTLMNGSMSSDFSCASCELTFAFGGLKVTSLETVTVPTFNSATSTFEDAPVLVLDENNAPISDGQGGFIFAKKPIFDTSEAWFKLFVDDSKDYNPGNNQYLEAQDGEVWLEGGFDYFNLTSGTIGGGLSESLLQATGGLAFNNFDPTTLFLSGSAQFGDDFPQSTQATGEFTGNTIPEPASIALFGLGLLGFAGMVRRRKA